MSDYSSHSPPDADPPRSGGLPTRRSEADPPDADSAEAPQQISLEEMMERLQRSGNSSSSGSSSGRRRRRSSSSSSEDSSRHRSSRSRSSSEDDDRSQRYEGETEPQERTRTVLPPPRQRESGSDRTRSERSPRRQPAPVRSRRWIYVLAALLLVGLALWLGIRLLNRWRIEGEGFRVNAGRRLSELTDRRLSIARFRQTGSNQLSTATLTIDSVQQDLLASASFANLTAEFTPGSWLADEWTVQSLRILQGDLVFQPGKTLNEQSLWTAQPAPVDRGVTPSGGFRMSMTSDPASVTVEQGRFDQLNLSWPGPDGKPESLTQMQGNFRMLNQSIQLEIAGGLLDTSAWPPFPVRQINAKLTGTTLDIISARLGFTADHEVRVTGSAQLTPDGGIQLKADIAPILLKHLLPDLWTNVLLGSFEANGAAWESHFKSGPEANLSGPFRVKGFVLRGLPFVDKIATLLRKPELALLEFPALTGQFRWTPAGTRLTDLSAVTAEGLVRLKGTASAVPGDAVAAEFVIEANEAYFAGLPPGAASQFTPGPEGWRTLTLTLGGTEGAVTDNIGIANPVIIQGRPSPATIEMPRMTVPEGVTPPQPQTPAQAPAPRAPQAAPPRPFVPPAQARPASDEELERQFKDLLGR